MRRENPEQYLTERRWPELSEVEDNLHRTLVPEIRKSAIKLTEFTDLYGEETVRADQAYLEKLEGKFRAEESGEPNAALWKKRGELFEAILNDQIESSDWFGERASVIVPSRYDDVVNGVDGIIEFDDEIGRSHLALAIDITKSSSHLGKKFRDIRESIEEGRLSRVKYFHSPDYFRGELQRVPRVVVGADQRTTEEVSKLLLSFKTRQHHPASAREDSLDQETLDAQRAEFRDARDQLARHPLQYQLLFQIKAQLEAFQNYALARKQKGCAEAYAKLLGIVDAVLEEKTKTKTMNAIQEEIASDDIHRLIIEKAGHFGE